MIFSATGRREARSQTAGNRPRGSMMDIVENSPLSLSLSLRRSSFTSAPLALRKTHTRASSNEARACTHVFHF
jgi:hypothetical protein